MQVIDQCGEERTIECASCSGNEVCGAVEENVCGCEPLECDDLDAQCGDHSDGCGGIISCGDCGSGESCTEQSDESFDCEEETCTAETCESLEVDCGTVSDGCGSTIDCGDCPDEQLCDGDNQCSCMPESDSSFCSDIECGEYTGADNCGDERTVDCGGCDSGYSCQENSCECQPVSVQQACNITGRECGEHSFDDGCGGTASGSCGTCADDEECHDGECICLMIPSLQACENAGYECGEHTLDVGCGSTQTVSCGSCSDNEECVDGECECVPRSIEQACMYEGNTHSGYTCGTHTLDDGCGGTVSGSCGTCDSDQTCDDGLYVCCDVSDVGTFCPV